MTFHSILFGEPASGEERIVQDPPEFFGDLNLDQIVDTITASRKEYNLKPFFYTRLSDLNAIEYRHQVMQDLEKEALFQTVQEFSTLMRTMRGYLATAKDAYYKYEKERWFLDAADAYCNAAKNLLQGLFQAAPTSRGLLAFRAYLEEYTESAPFKELLRKTEKLKADLAAIRYTLRIKGDGATVRAFNQEIDYSQAVDETFAKFKHGAAKDYRIEFTPSSGMNHVQAMVLNGVARLNPNAFLTLDEFYAQNQNYIDDKIADFDREIQFYVAYLEYLQRFIGAGLHFCYPQVSNTTKEVRNREGFDLALAYLLILEGKAPVCNDFNLNGPERIFIVTGPNQGGKTTFARTFGQIHYLASLGCPVPGTEAHLFLCDRLFTHFDREEDISNLRGKLEDDLIRIHHILGECTPTSILIMNEIFASTTLKDAVYLSRRIIERITQLDCLCVCVTFLDELSSLNEKTVSMVAEVSPENPTQRTYKVQKRPADGLAYAVAIAEKYSLTYECLKERVKA